MCTETQPGDVISNRPIQHVQHQVQNKQQLVSKNVEEVSNAKKSDCVQQQLQFLQSQKQPTPLVLTNLNKNHHFDSIPNISKENPCEDDNPQQQEQISIPVLVTTTLNPSVSITSLPEAPNVSRKRNNIVECDDSDDLNLKLVPVATTPAQFHQENLELEKSEAYMLVQIPTGDASELSIILQATESDVKKMQLTEEICAVVDDEICHSNIIENGVGKSSESKGIVLNLNSIEIKTENPTVEKNKADCSKNDVANDQCNLELNTSLTSNHCAIKQREYDETERTLQKKQYAPNEIAIAERNSQSKGLNETSSNKKVLVPTSEGVKNNIQNEGCNNENNVIVEQRSSCTENITQDSNISNLNGQSVSQLFLISYNKGQWSPKNPTGKKKYDKEQLLQLREAKASRRQPEVANVSILPTPNLMPSFVRPKRVQSMVGSLGSNRGAAANVSGAEIGNYGNKQTSLSGVHGRGSMKGMIHVNLSLNQDVKLNETDNAWRPRVLVKSEVEADPEVKSRQEKEELIRRVRGILNKLTPEKFDTLVEEIIKLKIDTPDKMEDVMVLVFEKAIDEPNFSVSYARLCHRLITEVKARDERMESGTKTNLAQFRAALLDKTEREFTQNVTKSKAKERKLQPILEKISECTDPTEKIELEAQLEEEERKIRRRSGGTVRFIGELFKISMLTGKIIYSCIETLLNPNSEDQLECLCKLLTTVGAKFEQTPINAKESNRCYSLDKTITRMQAIASKTDKEGAKVSSRVRFMLQDVIDLRRDKWQSKRNEAPKTMGQVEKEMKTEQLSSQYLNYAGSVSGGGAGGSNGQSSLNSGNKRDERGGRYDSRSGYGGSHSQRGDPSSLRRQQQMGGNVGHSNSNSDDSTWHIQTSKGGSRVLDAMKLEGLTTANNFDNKKMGGVSQFIWSQRQSSTPSSTPTNSFAALSALSDSNRSNERDRDRDRSGPRSKGSYNKGSTERERYSMQTRSGSSQASRESSSSRGPQSRSTMSTSSLPKSASHSKYTQSMQSSNIMSGKPSVTGPMSLYSQRENLHSNPQTESSRTPTEPPIAVFEKSSDGDIRVIKSVITEMLEIASTSRTLMNSIEPCILRVRESQRCALLFYIMTDYLHLRHVGKLQRRYLGNIVVYLTNYNYLSIQHFNVAYKQFCEIASDLALDIPDLWKYIIEFTGPLINKKLITIYDLWCKQLKEDNAPSFGKRFLKTFLDYCLREIGPSFTRTIWKKTNIKWTDFLDENEVMSFIETNKYEYIENDEIQSAIVFEFKEDNFNSVTDNLELLLKEEAAADCIIDYINGNVGDIDKQFIRILATKLCDFAISYKENSYKLETDCFQKICIPVLQRYIDSKEEFELECLYSMQQLVARLEHPRGLLSDLFGELYDADVIPQDSFIKWRDSKEQSAGKGVAVKGLNPFFNHVLTSETSDENN
uniref:Eukaryotic translation initiation factor 4 gamma 1 n=1 Tax=Ceratitis capitata TaxID=7213 RepID=W8BQA9_CERCA